MVNEAQAATAAELSPPPPVPVPAGDPAAAAAPVGDPSVAASQQPSGAANSQTGATTDLPQIADDADLIEKEWVSKAKKIVAETSHDPHLQSEKLTEVRADYVKKRFNIDIKLARE